MAKRIVLSFDGTWNTPSENFAELSELRAHFEQLRGVGPEEMAAAIEEADTNAGVETNVCRLYRSVLRFSNVGADGMAQTKWYDDGVGTNWYDRIAGGAFGLGLSQKIRQGYWQLAKIYEQGDAVFIFGFSRGAYTARSLVGFIRNCGLLPAAGVGDGPDSLKMLEAYELYRTRDDSADSERARAFRAENDSNLIPIKFLGVWDTVGALGIPVESFDAFNRQLFEFHDTELSRIVENAYHAIALDENREPYAPTLWKPKVKPQQNVEQRWFVGAHADVGGGYAARELSDITLRWMQEKAQSCGLNLDPLGIPQVTSANTVGPLADSFVAFLGGTFRLFHKRYFRPVCKVQFGNEDLNETVLARIEADFDYRPKNDGLEEALKMAEATQ